MRYNLKHALQPVHNELTLCLQWYLFSSSQCKVLFFHALLKVLPKNTLSSYHIGLTEK